MFGGGSAAQWEVDFKADLSADLWAGNVAATQECEGNGHTAVELVPASGKTLELVFSQAFVVRYRAVGLHAQAEARIKVVHQRETSGVNVTAGVLGTQNAGAGIAGEQESKIGVEPRLLRKGSWAIELSQ